MLSLNELYALSPHVTAVGVYPRAYVVGSYYYPRLAGMDYFNLLTFDDWPGEGKVFISRQMLSDVGYEQLLEGQEITLCGHRLLCLHKEYMLRGYLFMNAAYIESHRLFMERLRLYTEMHLWWLQLFFDNVLDTYD